MQSVLAPMYRRPPHSSKCMTMVLMAPMTWAPLISVSTSDMMETLCGIAMAALMQWGDLRRGRKSVASRDSIKE